MSSLEEKTIKQMKVWLGFTLAMLLCMVFIGGVTRLTDSGLSMVEWRPLLGAIPPINETEWLEVFEKYKSYPEYKIVNQRMNLEEFKFIFFWEYFHRLFGRMIGLVFFLPYMFFFLLKKLNKRWNRRLLSALVLGGSQGLLGWFMVKSGLVDRPDVSHFRLAAHFSLALLIIGYIWWLLLELRNRNAPARVCELSYAQRSKAKRLLSFFMAALCVQVVYGAFVAGLDAGIGFNTFPKMGRYWIPKALTSGGDFFSMLIHSNAGVQFVHRSMGWLLFGFAVYFIYFALSKLPKSKERSGFLLVSGLVIAQFLLGIATLLSMVNLSLASAHQMLGCFLTMAAIKCFYDVTQVNKPEISQEETANKTTA